MAGFWARFCLNRAQNQVISAARKSLAFFSGGSKSYCFLCAAVLIVITWTFCSGERNSWSFLCLAASIVNTWAFWSGERDLQCLCCAAVLFFTNRCLSSGERDSCFSLCASASVSKFFTFFSDRKDSRCFLCASASLHNIWLFSLVRETVDSSFVQWHLWPNPVLSYQERETLNTISLLQNLFSNFVWRNIQHAF